MTRKGEKGDRGKGEKKKKKCKHANKYIVCKSLTVKRKSKEIKKQRTKWEKKKESLQKPNRKNKVI